MNTDAPPVDPALFDRLRAALASGGPTAAVDALCQQLQVSGDTQGLFYARLLRKRVELGVSPFPTGPSADLPPHTHDAYEEAIRQAGREAGNALLARGDIPRAWAFFRMLGEADPVREALRAYTPGPDDDLYPVVEVAWQHGLLPEKGFDLVLDRSGVCSAITLTHSSDLSQNPALREYCTTRLVRALYEQLRERLRGDLAARGTDTASDARVGEMVAAHPDLFAEDVYHIDTSHLSSVCQTSLHLPPGEALDLARELCAYGAKLSPGLRGTNDPPFQDTYADYKVYLDVLAGHQVEEGLADFRRKLEAGAAEGYRYPAEVMVNLLLKADRLPEAVAVAKEHLADADERSLSCPGLTELAKRAGDYGTIADAAKGKADPVTYLAALLAGR
ncbi:MAG: hypothetical protein U0871_23820 [Gemmataceae bacterium]